MAASKGFAGRAFINAFTRGWAEGRRRAAALPADQPLAPADVLPDAWELRVKASEIVITTTRDILDMSIDAIERLMITGELSDQDRSEIMRQGWATATTPAQMVDFYRRLVGVVRSNCDDLVCAAIDQAVHAEVNGAAAAAAAFYRLAAQANEVRHRVKDVAPAIAPTRASADH